ncbi:MAG: tetratricopeptide repeat protein [Spirochaetes bacterium]|nr:tetratricopeptide repeat protein [Spirochaetota bacterium]
MYRSKTRTRSRQNSSIFTPVQAVAVVLSVVLLVSLTVFLGLRLRGNPAAERQEILRQWNDGNFEQAFLMSRSALVRRPLDYFLLTINGFSAFQLGVSQINTQSTLAFMDDSIRSLRRSLLLRESARDGRVFYVLGKAYTYKGEKFADLAVKFLEAARALSFEAGDLDEYLGLAHAALGDHRQSVQAFARALDSAGGNPCSLLLSIARSYMALGDFARAGVFLSRCIENSPDARSVAVARLLFAETLMARGDLEEAENLFVNILYESGTNAEVHFQLGELYNIRGDVTRARFEWSRAHMADPAHAGARARLDI